MLGRFSDYEYNLTVLLNLSLPFYESKRKVW